MREVIENFNTQKKCDDYRKQLGDRKWEIYWKDTGGIVIRESEFDDMIGDKDNFATIQLCDWYGWNDGEVNEHKYTFAVFLYEDGNENGYSMYDTIEEAVEDYKRTCSKIKQLYNEECELLEDFEK